MAPLVELLVGVSGIDFTWRPGEIIDMTDEQAAAWADDVRGRLVDSSPPAPPGPEPADPGPPGPVPPPKSGAGSGVDAWLAYAAAHHVELPADAKREQIWAALTDAGIPIEPSSDTA